MVSRVIDVVLPKTVTAIFSLHHGARIGGSIPSSPTKSKRGEILAIIYIKEREL